MAVVQLETEDHQPENGFVSPETTSPGLLTQIDRRVLPFLGAFGKYQRQLIVLTWIPALFIGFSQYSNNFLLAQPNNTCVNPFTNVTNLTRSHSHLFHSPHNSSTRPAFIYANGTYGTHNDTANMQCMCNEWTFELKTGLVRNVVTKWSLVCDSAWKVHIAKFSLLVGSIFGYLVFGVLADWFGRHPVLIISVLFMLVFGLTVAFSINVTMFSTMRFFEGFCLAGIYLSLYVLRIELCLPGWRFSMTMVANFVVLGGQLLMPGMAYLCRDWQVLQAAIICPLVLMLSYIWIFPESLRWLLATQQYCRSKVMMGHIAKKNQVNTELDPDQILLELQRNLHNKSKRTCIVKMVRTRNLWKNIVVLCVNSLTGYGIHHCFARSMMDHEAHETTMFHNFYADYYTMAGIAVASCMALCPAVGLMGRRGGLLMFMIVTALASLLQLGLLNLLGKYSHQLNIERSDTLNRNFSIAFSIIGMFSSHAVSNLSIFFCAEITPTVIRGGGLGLVLASAGFGMLTAPIMELHNQKGYFLHHVIFACCTLICIICILLLPETRYQALPETLAEGECYTRQPIIPPRKPGEQRLLLGQADGGRDTPLPEAAAMGSTASSAVDLTAPSALDINIPLEVLPAKAVLEGPNGRSASLSAPLAALDKGRAALASSGCLLSSTPLRRAPSASDPLLDPAEESSVPLMNSMEPPTDQPTPLITNAGPSPTLDSGSPLVINPLPRPSLDSLIPAVSEPPPVSDVVRAAPLIEPPPTSTLGSPAPLVNDVISFSPTGDSASPPTLESSPAPALVSAAQPLLEAGPAPALVSAAQPLLEAGPAPALVSAAQPLLEADSLEEGPPPVSECTIPPAAHSVSVPEFGPTSAYIVHPSLDSVAPLVLVSAPASLADSAAPETPLTTMDCTISSPIDFGILPITDCTISENGTVNRVTSL
ncbi:solute carrier family 22 member 23-like [Aplochiton taeniatus]